MAGAGPSRGKIVATINVTPLVDVVLVLLIIFMVTATYIARQAFEADLPKAASGDPIEANPPLVIEVRADRAIWVGGEPFTIETLAERVRRKDGPGG
ncbi:MAG: biopolymer transporter ExbD, partial [Myxococcales bacterium]|nr:biopolymer transporter ExbD [Myxococcales bacterium]